MNPNVSTPGNILLVADEELNDVFADNKHEITRMEQTMTEMLHKMNTMKKQAQENVAVKQHLLIRNKKVIEIETDYQTLNKKAERSFIEANEKTEAEFKKKREDLEAEYLKSKEKNKAKYQQEIATVRGQYLQQKQAIETTWAEILNSFSELTRQKIIQYEQERIGKESLAEKTNHSILGVQENNETKSVLPFEKKYNDAEETDEKAQHVEEKEKDLPMPDFVCKTKNVVAEIRQFASCVLNKNNAMVRNGALERMNVAEIAALLITEQKPLPPAILELIKQEKGQLPPLPNTLTMLIQASLVLHSNANLPTPHSVPLQPVQDDD